MDEQTETATPKDEKHSINWGFIVWPVVILILYVLSSGPVMMMGAKGRIAPENKVVLMFYSPFGWAMDVTPLGKPMRIYYHLWAPKHFDKNGEVWWRAMSRRNNLIK